MSGVKAFIDTNMFVYLYSQQEPEKQQAVIAAMNQYDRVVSTQVLNEFCNVCIRKLNFQVSAVKQAVEEICRTCEILSIDESNIQFALDIREKYGYSYYDSLIIVSALDGGCDYLLTEDLSDGQKIEDT
ncbi:MAG: PIN domain-containing protein, partial [Oscillospiraceae bacterium]|nr:PIN domain-containing protein [Oscillospiraceae bacterium]